MQLQLLKNKLTQNGRAINNFARFLSDDQSNNTFKSYLQALYPDAVMLSTTNRESTLLMPDGKRYNAALDINENFGYPFATLTIKEAKPSIPIQLIEPVPRSETIQLKWNNGIHHSMNHALQSALPGAQIVSESWEHPFTTMQIHTPQGEAWELSWLTGGIVASYSATLTKVGPIETFNQTEKPHMSLAMMNSERKSLNELATRYFPTAEVLETNINQYNHHILLKSGEDVIKIDASGPVMSISKLNKDGDKRINLINHNRQGLQDFIQEHFSMSKVLRQVANQYEYSITIQDRDQELKISAHGPYSISVEQLN